MRISLVPAVLAALLLSAGCGDDTTPIATGAPPSDRDTTPEVHLRVETGGGFVPIDVNLATFPTLVVAEGTAWIPGAQILIYPPPAVPALQSAPLTDEDLAALASRLDEAGALFDGTDFGEPPVSDLPTTTVEATFDGTERRLDVYALYEELAEETLTEEQRQARQQVRDLITDLQGIVDSPDRPWEVGLSPRIRASSIPTDPEAQPDDGLAQGSPVPWPEGVPEPQAEPDATVGCVALTDPARQALLDAARDTNVATTWQLSSGPHQVVLRPLFPGEPDCP